MKHNTFPIIFQSVEYVKTHLMKKYKRQQISSYKEYAYKNCYPFVYYIKLGETYFQEGISAPTSIKPVLFFYGLTHWLKAAVLQNDPTYPATTQVLAHGVSTRKKKKRDYRFLFDEVKIQKDGFFPFVSEKLFNTKLITGEKYKMGHLLKCIPELMNTMKQLQNEEPLLQIAERDNSYIAPIDLLTKLKLTEKQFERKVKEKVAISISCEVKDQKVFICQKDKNGSLPIYKSLDDSLYIPVQLPLYWQLPEVLIHFLLLFNLSMICRYEAEWWGDLLYSFSSDDLIYVESFLQCTEKKIPFLITKLFNHTV